MSKANLQADGLVEKSAQEAADQQETEEEDSSPHNLPMWSPVQRSACGPSQYELLFRNMSDFNRMSWEMSLHLCTCGWHWWWRICCEK